jgi:hypothetical protein
MLFFFILGKPLPYEKGGHFKDGHFSFLLFKGSCKLWWLDSQSQKSIWMEKVTLEWKKYKNSMLSGPYVVINQLIKSIWKDAHLENFLSYMLGEKKNQFNKKMTKIRTFENKVQI